MSDTGAIQAPFVRDASALGADASFAEITARRRGRIRRFFYQRPRAMDAVVVFVYLLLAAPTVVTAAQAGTWGVVVVLAAIAAVLTLRRRFTLPVTAVVAGLELLATLFMPWGSNVSAGLWFALYSVGVSRPRRPALFVFAVASLPLSLLYLFMGTDPGSMRPSGEGLPENIHFISNIAAAASILLSNLIATGIGISVRQRREHEQEIAAWAARTAQLGSVNERTRIAREMHDVVAHSLTVMISLSDGAAVAVRKDPARAGEALNELSRTGRTALADMRRVLGVLREESPGPAPLQPLAANHDLAELMDGFRTAGLPLYVQHTGPALPDDPAFGLTVYRIVQESLTNVLRYSRGLSRVDVAIVREGDVVTIDVSDDGRVMPASGEDAQATFALPRVGHGTPMNTGWAAARGAGVVSVKSLGTGQGISGMRERARIFAGTVDAAPRPGGGWHVHAELFWNSNRGNS